MRYMYIIFILILSLPASAKDFSAIIGRSSVIDGDTIDIQGQRVRIWGIDAPESRQTCEDADHVPYRCGKVAAFALSDWLDKSQPITCEPKYKDRYQRFVAMCYRNDKQDIGLFMVKNGYALDWPSYSKGFYAEVQMSAKQDKRGIWQGAFIEPWKWRKQK